MHKKSKVYFCPGQEYIKRAFKLHVHICVKAVLRLNELCIVNFSESEQLLFRSGIHGVRGCLSTRNIRRNIDFSKNISQPREITKTTPNPFDRVKI